MSVNLVDFGADPTGVLDAYPAWLQAKATGKPIFVPEGTYRMSASPELASGMNVLGEGINATEFVFDNVEGFFTNPAHAHENIHLRDFSFRLDDGNWGSENNRTALLLSNVSYSLFERIKPKYFKYGVWLRRVNVANAGSPPNFLANYFNHFDLVHTFGSFIGFKVQDTGGTVNKISFTRCKAEDNGQYTGGYGMDIDGVGHTVSDFYAGLPFHAAALRLGPATMNLFARDIYGESTHLPLVIQDDTSSNRNNVIVGVHADGAADLVVRSNPASNSLYINAGKTSNVIPERRVVAVKSPVTLAANAMGVISINIPDIMVGDSCRILPPSGWHYGLLQGQPIIVNGSVHLPYHNAYGAPLTPPTGEYTVYWQDRT